jgi:hypothetical protein
MLGLAETERLLQWISSMEKHPGDSPFSPTGLARVQGRTLLAGGGYLALAAGLGLAGPVPLQRGLIDARDTLRSTLASSHFVSPHVVRAGADRIERPAGVAGASWHYVT